MPVLLACRELSGNAIAIFSGPRLDVSPERGLVGECDFLLARTPPVPEVRASLILGVFQAIVGGSGSVAQPGVAVR